MIWAENEEIMTTLLVKDPFTETRIPRVERPKLVSIKKEKKKNQWIKTKMFLKSHYLKAISRNQLGNEKWAALLLSKSIAPLKQELPNFYRLMITL